MLLSQVSKTIKNELWTSNHKNKEPSKIKKIMNHALAIMNKTNYLPVNIKKIMKHELAAVKTQWNMHYQPRKNNEPCTNSQGIILMFKTVKYLLDSKERDKKMVNCL